MIARMCVLLAVMALPGCSGGVTSKHPISAPQDAKFEQEFAGAWRQVDTADNEVNYVHIGAFGGDDVPESVTRVLLVMQKTQDGKMGVGFVECLGYVTRIGEKRFFNLVEPKLELDKGFRAEWKPQEFRHYELMKLELLGDELVASNMDLEAARRFVNDGKLAGTVDDEDKEGKVHGVTLEATSEQLRTFLATPESDALFSGKPLRLKKVK